MARILALIALLTVGCAAQSASVNLKFSSDTDPVYIYTHETTDTTVFDTSRVVLARVYTPADSGSQSTRIDIKYKKPVSFISRSVVVIDGATLYSKWSNRTKYLPLIKGIRTLEIGD